MRCKRIHMRLLLEELADVSAEGVGLKRRFGPCGKTGGSAAGRQRVKYGLRKTVKNAIRRLEVSLCENKQTGCWEWVWPLKPKTGYILFYPRLRVCGVKWSAHHFAYVLYHGEIPEGKLVLHKCDNVSCCNPHHLEIGRGRPQHSACFHCPLQSDEEWLQNTEEDQQKAIALDVQIREKDPNVFLHRSCKPLSEVKFKSGIDGVPKELCESGLCFV